MMDRKILKPSLAFPARRVGLHRAERCVRRFRYGVTARLGFSGDRVGFRNRPYRRIHAQVSSLAPRVASSTDAAWESADKDGSGRPNPVSGQKATAAGSHLMSRAR